MSELEDGRRVFGFTGVKASLEAFIQEVRKLSPTEQNRIFHEAADELKRQTLMTKAKDIGGDSSQSQS
jgi:hypothetical protein